MRGFTRRLVAAAAVATAVVAAAPTAAQAHVKPYAKVGYFTQWGIYGRNFQLAKVQITFRGWLFSPRFGYNAYVWTSQASQGLGAQVVAAGNINWTFNDALRVNFGIHSLPSTRSTNVRPTCSS